MHLNRFSLGCLLAACISPAFAGSYIGLQAGTTKYNDWISAEEYQAFWAEEGYAFDRYKTEDGDTAFKLYIGLPLGENADLRIGYANLGEASANAYAAGKVSHTYEVQGVFIDALGKLKPTPEFSLFAKLGAAYTNAEVKISAQSNIGSASDKMGESKQLVLIPGLGLSYDFTPQVGLIVEIERYLDVGDDDETPKLDIDMASAGLYFRF